MVINKGLVAKKKHIIEDVLLIFFIKNYAIGGTRNTQPG